MKKNLPLLILFILALLLWDAMADPFHLSYEFGDGDGVFGTLIGALLAGGGIIIGLVALLFVAIVLAVVFAGVGIVVVAALIFAAIAVALALSPLLLPLLIPVAIIWYLASRKHQRSEPAKPAAL